MIEVLDDFLNESDFKNISKKCWSLPFVYGEVDTQETPPTGLISELSPEDNIYKIFQNAIRNKLPALASLDCYRCYVNCFSPSENPYWHTDGLEGVTLLYYPKQPQSWNMDEGGETQFFINKEIKGILPMPNRMVVFDATILHKATCFRNSHRFSLALKFS